MHLKDILKVGILAFFIAFFALACASSREQSDFELDVDSGEIHVAISKEAARGVMEELIGSDFECEGGIYARTFRRGRSRGLLSLCWNSVCRNRDS